MYVNVGDRGYQGVLTFRIPNAFQMFERPIRSNVWNTNAFKRLIFIYGGSQELIIS